MKRISEILFSSKTMVFLLVLAAIAMGSGTFIEDKYDTITARNLVYNTWWFELLFVLMALNFIGHIRTFKMLRKKRIGGLIFHLSFIIMIIGAGITRYFGYEGNMHIREGESSNILYSSEPYLRVSMKDKETKIEKDFQVDFSPYLKNDFHGSLQTPSNAKVDIRVKQYLPNAEEIAEDNQAGGKDMIEIVVANENGRERVFLEKGQANGSSGKIISFTDSLIPGAVSIRPSDTGLLISAPGEMMVSDMSGRQGDLIPADSAIMLLEKHIYSSGELVFVYFGYHPMALKKMVESKKGETGFDALMLEIGMGSKTYETPMLIAPGQVASFQEFDFDGSKLNLAYGKKPIELPFSLQLNDFILERYAGSESPSSYASEVTVMDSKNNKRFNHRIFMNNVLDYGGYRFFQSSYDQDEKGTILSVNHDFWGTMVTYAGYLLLSIGFLITLFNKDSRFLTLRRVIVEIRKERKSGFTILLILIISGALIVPVSGYAEPVNAVHAEKYGHLITQAVDGRFEPVNSLAYDVLHKITRKDKFNFSEKGEMEAMQVLLDMMADPKFWKQQKIVYVKEQSVRDVLGITTKQASFNDFFDKDSKYKLANLAEEAFRKKPVDQNTFDKEIIRVDERVNVFMMVFKGSMLRIFPEPGKPDAKWISWDEDGARIPLQGVINIINQDLKLPVLTYAGIMQAYMRSLIASTKTGDYSQTDKILGYISSIQKQEAAKQVLPSEAKINAEIYYNEAQIFIVLKNLYAFLSLFLLLFAFIDNIRQKKSKLITFLLNTGIAILAIGFLYQTFGMALRSYLLGYAPWSNGYEALILVSWGTILAGFTFARYSKITLAATSLLAFFVLMTASHSSYDPQLTNLTPVLKSYWLIIHVAVLTISYGFLGLGFILGIINMFIYLFKTKKNYQRLDLLIYELTYINEMNLTIGIVLATVGTFLGGVWANESWGRYWGWDAKETWALIIVITYTLLLHLRLIPKLNGKLLFNAASIISYGSVLMTFFGVNYFLSKGMHSYGAGDHAIFPVWAWVSIIAIVLLIVTAKLKESYLSKQIIDKE